MNLVEQHRLDYARDIPTLVDCGCVATVWNDDSGVEIDYCPMHRAAPEMAKALKVSKKMLDGKCQHGYDTSRSARGCDECAEQIERALSFV